MIRLRRILAIIALIFSFLKNNKLRNHSVLLSTTATFHSLIIANSRKASHDGQKSSGDL